MSTVTINRPDGTYEDLPRAAAEEGLASRLGSILVANLQLSDEQLAHWLTRTYQAGPQGKHSPWRHLPQVDVVSELVSQLTTGVRS